MRRTLLCAAVFAGQVGAVDGMYYLSVRGANLVSSDFAVFYMPILIALYLHYKVVFSSRNPSLSALTVRVVASLALTFVGFSVAMLVALNTWGS